MSPQLRMAVVAVAPTNPGCFLWEYPSTGLFESSGTCVALEEVPAGLAAQGVPVSCAGLQPEPLGLLLWALKLVTTSKGGGEEKRGRVFVYFNQK